MIQPTFDGIAAPTPPLRTAQRRRTQWQRDRIAAGMHPATGVALADNGETCGTCGNLRGSGYYKCALVKSTHGAGTDIRRSWPACARWKYVGA